MFNMSSLKPYYNLCISLFHSFGCESKMELTLKIDALRINAVVKIHRCLYLEVGSYSFMWQGKVIEVCKARSPQEIEEERHLLEEDGCDPRWAEEWNILYHRWGY
jgi:hypothetical protein